MPTYNKKICINNIYTIAKDKNIKIGELESKSGVSNGYLSRIAKDDNEVNIGIDILCSIADALCIPLDLLITYDLSNLSATEKYMVDFLIKLLDKTKNNEEVWKYITLVNFYDCDINKYGFIDKMRTSGYTNGFDYYSYYYQTAKNLAGDLFYFDINFTCTLVLFKIFENENECSYEMYMDTLGGSIKKICCSNKGTNKIFEKLLDEIYLLVQKKVKEPIIEGDVKEILDDFMNK